MSTQELYYRIERVNEDLAEIEEEIRLVNDDYEDCLIPDSCGGSGGSDWHRRSRLEQLLKDLRERRHELLDEDESLQKQLALAESSLSSESDYIEWYDEAD